MTTALLATPDGPDPRHWHPDTRTVCLLLAGLLLLSLGLSLWFHVCFGVRPD